MGESLPWWARRPARLSVLAFVLVVVGGSAVATRVLGAGGRRSVIDVNGCALAGQEPLREMSLTALTAAVRAAGVDALSARGEQDQRGPVRPGAAWHDSYPDHDAAGAVVPAGYEIRWWSRRDHRGADLFAFRAPADAARFVKQAGSVWCRSYAHAFSLAVPKGARGVVWRNPLGAWQADLLFAHGPLAFRVIDVPVTGRNRPIDPARLARAITATEHLACRVWVADCRLGR